MLVYLSLGSTRGAILVCKERIRSHTQTLVQNNTNDHTKNHPPHLTTIEGGAATMQTG